MKTFNKRLNQNTKTGMTFVLSTFDVDRSGDRVFPSWDLEHFKLNPIALAFHKHDKPIGTWENIRVIGNELLAELKLAKAGTSAFVDEIRSLVEQGVLRATSIGFRSGDAKSNSFGGLDLKDNYLLEVSIVSVPDQQYALRKSLSEYLSSDELDSICSVNGCNKSKSSEEQSSVTATPQTTTIVKKLKGMTMTYAERIKSLQQSISAKQAQLAELNAKHDLSDEDMATMATLTSDVAKESSRLKQFEEMEKSLVGETQIVKATPAEPSFTKEQSKNAVIKAVVAMSKSAIDGIAVQEVLKSTYAGDKAVATFVKASTAPASIGDLAWAGNLVQDGYGGYLEDLMNETVFGKVGAQAVTFGKNGSITLPFRSGTGSLSGAFIEEGAPIPVKADAYSTVKISPYKLGVISVFSKELFRKSIPNIEALIRNHIQTDTANVIDATFLDATPADATRPAGLEDSAGAGNIIASVGATVDNIIADFNGVFDRLTASNLGGSGTILIHPSRLRGMRMKTDALGNFVFRGADVLTGFNFVESINVPSDKVYVIDDKALIKGIGFGVEFEPNSSATIVMGDPAEQIQTSDGTTPTHTALPVQSMFQTDSTALRMTMDISWKQVRANGVQILTGVAW